MATSIARQGTFYRVDTGPVRPGRGVFTTYRMPKGRLIVSMRRDAYEAALRAAADVMRRIVREEEPYKP